MSSEAFFRNIGRAPDAAAHAFFSRENVAALQTQLRYEVHRCTGAVIGDQSPNALRSAMEAVYEEHVSNASGCGAFASGQSPGMFSGPGVRPGYFPPRECVSAPVASVAQLNSNVLRRIVPNVVSGIRSHRRYLEDISNPNPVPLAMPQFVSSAGSKQLTLFRKS